MKLIARISRSLAVVSLLGAAPALAQLPVDGTWYEFSWSDGVGSVSTTPWGTSFTFTTATAARIDITDAQAAGDMFRLSWTGTTVGTFETSAVPNDDYFYIGNDPDTGFGSTDFSHGSVYFGPGLYTMMIEVTQLASDGDDFFFTDGAAFIRALDAPAESTVPEPATMTLLATGLAGLGAARRRKKS